MNSYPVVPWKVITGFRDIAAHKYQTLRMEDVYETVTVDFRNCIMKSVVYVKILTSKNLIGGETPRYF